MNSTKYLLLFFAILSLTCTKQQDSDSNQNNEVKTNKNLINQTNAFGQRIGFWKKTDDGVGDYLKYDSLGRFEGSVYYSPDKGTFHFAHPNLIIDNTTSLQVNRLFSHYVEGMLAGVYVCNTASKSLFIQIRSDISETDSLFFIHVNENGKFLSLKNKPGSCFKALEPIITQKENKEFDLYRFGYFETLLGNFEIEIPETLCADTKLSRLTLRTNDGTLNMGFGGNIQMAEYDIDKDGIKELYVFNFFSCKSFLEIYQVKS